MGQKLISRFISLIADGESIYGRYELKSNNYDPKLHADFIEWQVKSQNILEVTCGSNSHYLSQYIESLKAKMGDSNKIIIHRLIPILKAAKNDLENGFLITIKQIIQAELFDSELEQAIHFLENGYNTAAAVTAGVVLETAIKELCKNHGINIFSPSSTKPKKLDVLNAELAKAGVYTVLQQKRITALADIRNNAAHGNTDQFNAQDVKEMIRDIENFLMNYAS